MRRDVENSEPSKFTSGPPQTSVGAQASDLSIRGIPEYALMAAVLMAAEWLLPGHASLASMSPQPFWIPVVLIAAQYGTLSGLAAALATVALSYLAGWPAPANGQEFYDYLTTVLREPALWSGTAFILGELRSRSIRRRQELLEQASQAETDRAAIARFNRQLEGRALELERQIAVAEDGSVETGLDCLARLREATPGNMQQALTAALSAFAGKDAKWSLLLVRDGALLRVEHLDEALVGGRFASIGCTSVEDKVLHERIIGLRETVSVWNEQHALSLDGVGVLVCPITSKGGGEVVGALVIETLAVRRLRPSIAIGIEFVAREIAGALARHQDRRTNTFCSTTGDLTVTPLAPAASCQTPTKRHLEDKNVAQE